MWNASFMRCTPAYIILIMPRSKKILGGGPERWFSRGPAGLSTPLARGRVKWIKIHPQKKIIMILFDFTRFLTQNRRYLWFPWIDFDEKYLSGIVMSYTLSYKNLESKISPILLLKLAPKMKFADNRQGTQGILE
jgi:hypothetical protein